jgi:integrase
MATIKYRLQSKKEISNIYARVRDGKNTDIETPTGFTTNPNLWSETKGEPLQKANNPEKLNLKVQLEKLKTKIIESLNTDKGSGTPINKEWLIDVIAKFKNPLLEKKTEYLKDLVKEYQTEMKTKINPKTKRQIAQTTIRNFNTTLMRLKKFEEHKKKRYLISEIDLTFFREFVSYEKENLLLAQNSISKDIKQIKTVCIDAKEKGFEINKQVEYKSFNVPNEKLEDKGKKLFVTITESEIELIKKCDLKKVNYIENARDWLIIGCWTGCRVSDLMQLTNDNIQITTKGQKFIRYTQSKTDKQVDIPIHSDVKEILERLGSFPRPISDQRFNEWIKKVCFQSKMTQEVHGTRQNPTTHRKEVGTFQKWELVRSHTCRRSFATNHYNKLPNKLIMAVTGHSTEKMLLNYIGETENDHLSDFLSVWNTPKVKDEKIVQMNTKHF